MSAPRTFGEQCPSAVTMVHGIYEPHGRAGDRLDELLPPITIVPASARTGPILELLAVEAAGAEPGQDAVLQRFLDLLLVIALRSWGAANAGSRPSGWLGAIADPAIGKALGLLHAHPEQSWTTTVLANRVGLSRATSTLMVRESITGRSGLTVRGERRPYFAPGWGIRRARWLRQPTPLPGL